MKNIVAVLMGPQKFELIEEEIPKLAEDEVLVRILACGLCHSDIPEYLGKSAQSIDEKGRGRMKAVEYPIRLGHEIVGIVEETGSAIVKYRPGDYVTGLIRPGFAKYVVTKTDLLVKIDRFDKDPSMCIGEPLMCTVNILRAANPEFGDTVVIIGCGSMGLLVIAGLRKSGARNIVAVDLKEDRLAYAEQLGATHTINAAMYNAVDLLSDITDGRLADVVIEITGSLKGLKTATELIKDASLTDHEGQGKILIPSLYSKQETWDPVVGYNLMYKAPILHSTHPRYALSVIDNFKRAIDAYFDDVLPIDQLITHRYSLEDINQGFKELHENKPDFIKGLIIP